MLNIFDGCDFGLYTDEYENIEQVFFASTGRDFCHAVAGTDRIGMDDANHVNDENAVKLRYRIDQFFGPDGVDDTVYYIYYHSICYVHRDNICV